MDRGESQHESDAQSDRDEVDSLLMAVAAGLELVAPSGILCAGKRVARYRLDHRLGAGGMGVVWAATHTITRRRVALKFVRGVARWSQDLQCRFMREARVANLVRHPNVIEIFDVFECEQGVPVMVMDLLSGQTLADRIAQQGRLSLAETADLLLPVVSAVGCAHGLGVVHRDLKPANIFLLEGRAPTPVKVLDFGVAKLYAQRGDEETDPIATGSGAMLGTPCYMAPEQALGKRDVDHRADIWALGVILYECLSGRRPVHGSNAVQIVLQLSSAGIEPLARHAAHLPREITELVTRMVAFARHERPTLREAADVLARFTAVRPPDFAEPARTHGADDDAQRGEPGLANLVARAPHTSRLAALARKKRSDVRWLVVALIALAVGAALRWTRVAPAAPARALRAVVSAPVTAARQTPALSRDEPLLSAPRQPQPGPATEPRGAAPTRTRARKHEAEGPAEPPAFSGGLAEQVPF